MKIDKSRPAHWWYLLCFGLQAVLARFLRFCGYRGNRNDVVLYGHKLNGNLLALYRQTESDDALPLSATFLTMDPDYHRNLRAQGVRSVLATGPGCALLLARAVAIVSDHGLHAMQILLGSAGLRFFDVWHGIPFKGFDADDFRIQHRYDEIWVASPLLARMYVERFGFRPEQVQSTGYARTDRLVRGKEEGPRARLGLPEEGPIILFAPTWTQDDTGRNIFPFGTAADEFLYALSTLAVRHGATCVLRTHLNSRGRLPPMPTGVVMLPSAEQPDTEAVLLASDVLVCDWSSIAFDYLLLERPAIFLDVPAPFRKGFSLGPEYRYGAVAGDMDAMLHWIDACLDTPESYWGRYRERHTGVSREVYGGCADGNAAKRCLARLRVRL